MRRKYRWLFSSGRHRRPGPKGPSQALIDVILEIKRRNPRVGGDYGYDGNVNRAVAVSVGMLREGLMKVYHADRIVDELAK